MIDHRIDLLGRIKRLEDIKEQTKRDIQHVDEKSEEYHTYSVRFKNCNYLIGLYSHRLEMLEHHIEESKVGLL